MSKSNFATDLSVFEKGELWDCPASHVVVARLTMRLNGGQSANRRAHTGVARSILTTAMCAFALLIALSICSAAILAINYLNTQAIRQMQGSFAYHTRSGLSESCLHPCDSRQVRETKPQPE